MAILQEIQVPLLAVNDTSLTVVEISFAGGSQVKKGDIIMVFETSKTSYDVEAAADGYIQYLCEQDRDYEVNTVVARIYSEAAEAERAAAPVAGGGGIAQWCVCCQDRSGASCQEYCIRPGFCIAGPGSIPLGR